MGVLKSLYGAPRSSQIPLNLLNVLANSNPKFKQAMQMASQLTNGNPANAKDIVMQKLQSGNISEEQLNQVKSMAKKMGVNDETLNAIKIPKQL